MSGYASGQVVQAGSLNLTALILANVYVVITPPANLLINGVQTNEIGMVGTAPWGPVSVPQQFGTAAQYAQTFGQVINRKYDMGTHVAIAIQQGAAAFNCVRVSDGTDIAATGVVAGVLAAGFILTGLFTGSGGNFITYTLGAGSAVGSFALTVIWTQTGRVELFNNITGTGAAFWANLVAAVNTGLNQPGGASQLVVASVTGAYAIAPAAVPVGTYLAAGTDGATTITATVLVGVNTAVRTGMYALTGSGSSIGVLCDADDSTQWTNQMGFGLANGMYMIGVFPAGQTIALAVSTKATAGIDSYAMKMMHGDWLWWSDQVNNVTRLVSPQSFAAGLLSNLSPEQSSLNKILYGVIGSQKVGTSAQSQSNNNTYSNADLTTLVAAGIDVITNPAPGGAYWACRSGHNSSSNATINGDNYTRMTNFIAYSLATGMGLYVGQPITTTLFNNITATLNSFFSNMVTLGLLANDPATGAPPYAVLCNGSNNPQSITALNTAIANVQVRYSPILEKFICNLMGGQSVIITNPTTGLSLAS